MTASPGDGERAAREGYYPDPSIPGYVRYWNGAAWVPGTSRPAASVAPAPTPAAAPAPAAAFASASASASAPAPASASASVSGPAPVDETGPVFLDETSATEALTGPRTGVGPGLGAGPGAVPGPGPDCDPAGWQADPLHQAGFGGPRDVRVSWGGPAEPEHRPGGISLARPAPAAAPAAPSAPARQLPAQAAAESGGVLSARPPAWPDAPGAGASGLTSSWPEAAPSAPRARSAPRPVASPEVRGPAHPAHPHPAPSEAEPYGGWPPSAPSAPSPTAAPSAPPAPSAFEPRDAGRSPVSAPAPARPAPVRPRPEAREAAAESPSRSAPPPAPRATEPAAPSGFQPRGAESAAPAAAPVPPAEATRAVFEEMAERAVRPAGLVRRTLARAVDSLVLAGVATAVALPLVPEVTAHVQVKVEEARASGRTTTVWLLDGTITGYLGLVLAAVLVFGVFYEALPTARWGRTPGKKLFGVRVLATATLRPPAFGAALRRWLVYALLGLPGSLWCLVDRPRRRAWHDRAAGTYVAR
ncbi:RDD family protein [Streptomyces sp. NBC_01276]|uniref:RDD family protein n=1 Tax=Streptomyces sp. NBC_01276 TaxID=2903808 RepID=UPI00352FE654